MCERASVNEFPAEQGMNEWPLFKPAKDTRRGLWLPVLRLERGLGRLVSRRLAEPARAPRNILIALDRCTLNHRSSLLINTSSARLNSWNVRAVRSPLFNPVSSSVNPYSGFPAIFEIIRLCHGRFRGISCASVSVTLTPRDIYAAGD